MWWWSIVFLVIVFVMYGIAFFIEEKWYDLDGFCAWLEEEREIRAYHRHAGKAYFDAYKVGRWNESPMGHIKHKRKAHRAGTR